MSKTKLMNGTILSSESGRSMVEILGVLSIIGMLTIGSIAGYRYAVDKHRANVALDTARKTAIACSSILTNRRAPRDCGIVISEMKLDEGWGIDTDSYDDIFAVTKTDVPRGVCRNLLIDSNAVAIIRKDDMGESSPTALSSPDDCGDADTIDLAFLWRDDLGAIDSTPGTPCGTWRCVNGAWVNDCTSNPTCPNGCEGATYPNCNGAACTPSWMCNGSYWVDSNHCGASGPYCPNGCSGQSYPNCASGCTPSWYCGGNQWYDAACGASGPYCSNGCSGQSYPNCASGCTPSWVCNGSYWVDSNHCGASGPYCPNGCSGQSYPNCASGCTPSWYCG
ncbi:MAG: hypothetical protein PHX68_00815, partial [Alphaproteobacteria bacterium]|nr:hypothetical protein [Alphaproteobacteria bacterium]